MPLICGGLFGAEVAGVGIGLQCTLVRTGRMNAQHKRAKLAKEAIIPLRLRDVVRNGSSLFETALQPDCLSESVTNAPAKQAQTEHDIEGYLDPEGDRTRRAFDTREPTRTWPLQIPYAARPHKIGASSILSIGEAMRSRCETRDSMASASAQKTTYPIAMKRHVLSVIAAL